MELRALIVTFVSVIFLATNAEGFVNQPKGVRFAYRYGGCPNTQVGMCPTAGRSRTPSVTPAVWISSNGGERKFLGPRNQIDKFLQSSTIESNQDPIDTSLDAIMAAKKAMYELENSLEEEESEKKDKTSLSFSSTQISIPSDSPTQASVSKLTARFSNRPNYLSNRGQFLRRDSSTPSDNQKNTNIFSSSQSEEDVLEKVKDVVASQLGVDKAKISSDSSFIKDLQADSLDSVELVMAFEEKFGVTIPDEDATKITTVQEAVNYIKNAL